MLRNMTIRHKLTLVIMFTCIFALLLAGVAFVLWGKVIFRQEMVSNLSTLAEVTGENCKASLSFQDAADATETLKALRVQPSVVFAEIRNKEGEHFAHYWRDALSYSVCAQKTVRQQESSKFSDGLLTVFRDIVLDAEPIGTVAQHHHNRFCGTIRIYCGLFAVINDPKGHIRADPESGCGCKDCFGTEGLFCTCPSKKQR